MAFDAVFARDVALPLVAAAYSVMNGSPALLPSGFAQTALIEADDAVLTAMMSDPQPTVTAMVQNTNIFGLMGPQCGHAHRGSCHSAAPQTWRTG